MGMEMEQAGVGQLGYPRMDPGTDLGMEQLGCSRVDQGWE